MQVPWNLDHDAASICLGHYALTVIRFGWPGVNCWVFTTRFVSDWGVASCYALRSKDSLCSGDIVIFTFCNISYHQTKTQSICWLGVVNWNNDCFWKKNQIYMSLNSHEEGQTKETLNKIAGTMIHYEESSTVIVVLLCAVFCLMFDFCLISNLSCSFLVSMVVVCALMGQV